MASRSQPKGQDRERLLRERQATEAQATRRERRTCGGCRGRRIRK